MQVLLESENFTTEDEMSSSSNNVPDKMKMMSKPKNISHRLDAGGKLVGFAGPVIQRGGDPDPIARYR